MSNSNVIKKTVAICGLAALVSTGAWAADAVAGRAVYKARCIICHRADGEGNPAMFKAAGVPLKSLTSDEVQSQSDADLKRVVTAGKGKMQRVAVKESDLDNLVAYVRTLKK